MRQRVVMWLNPTEPVVRFSPKVYRRPAGGRRVDSLRKLAQGFEKLLRRAVGKAAQR